MRTIPERYRLADRWLMDEIFPQWLAIGNVLLFAGMLIFGWGLSTVHGNGQGIYVPRDCIQWNSLLALPLVVVLVVIFHEGAHALAIRLMSKPVEWGAGVKSGLPYAYVTTPVLLTRAEMARLLVAPTLLLSALWLGLIMTAGPCVALYATAAAIFNLMGACGDIWMLVALAVLPRDVLLGDHRSGTDVYLPDGRDVQPAVRLGVFSWLQSVAAMWTGFFILLPVAVVANDFLPVGSAIGSFLSRLVTVDKQADGVLLDATGFPCSWC